MLKSWFIALNWISFGLSLLTLVINLSSKAKRQFPARLTTVFTASCCAFHVVLLYGYFDDFNQLVIPETHTGRWSACSIQGGLFQFAALAVTCWWIVICFNLWRVVAMGDTLPQARKREPAYHVLSWSIPAITVAMLFGIEGFGTEVGALYCWVTTEDSSWWKIVFFYSFMTLFCIVGIAWCVSIMLTVRRYQRQYRATVARQARITASRSSSSYGGTTVSNNPLRGSAAGKGKAGLSPTGRKEAAMRSSVSPVRRSRGSSGMGGQEPGEHFAYYQRRQVLFLMVFLVRFCVFVAWEVNYKLFQANSSSINFPFAFVVNYLVGSLGFDCFWLIGLARDSRTRIAKQASSFFTRSRLHRESVATESLLSGDEGGAEGGPGDADQRPRGVGTAPTAVGVAFGDVLSAPELGHGSGDEDLEVGAALHASVPYGHSQARSSMSGGRAGSKGKGKGKGKGGEVGGYGSKGRPPLVTSTSDSLAPSLADAGVADAAAVAASESS